VRGLWSTVTAMWVWWLVGTAATVPLGSFCDRVEAVLDAAKQIESREGRGLGILVIASERMLASGLPADTDAATATKVGSVVHALCVRDGHPVPPWVMQARSPVEVPLVPAADLLLPFGQRMRRCALAWCGHRWVYFSAATQQRTNRRAAATMATQRHQPQLEPHTPRAHLRRPQPHAPQTPQLETYTTRLHYALSQPPIELGVARPCWLVLDKEDAPQRREVSGSRPLLVVHGSGSPPFGFARFL